MGEPKDGSDEHQLNDAGSSGFKRRLLNPLRSLRKFFSHRSKRSDDVTSSPGEPAVRSISDLPGAHVSSKDSSSHMAAKRVSLSADCIYPPEDVVMHTGQMDKVIGVGRVADFKKAKFLPRSADSGVGSSSSANASYRHSMSLSSVTDKGTFDIGCHKTDPQLPAVEDVEENFFQSKWSSGNQSENVELHLSNNGAVEPSAVIDLNIITRSTSDILDRQAASHRLSVRPRGQRKMMAYRSQTNEAEQNVISTRSNSLDGLKPGTDSSQHAQHLDTTGKTLSKDRDVSSKPLKPKPSIQSCVQKQNTRSDEHSTTHQRDVVLRRRTIAVPNDSVILEAIARRQSAKQSSVATPVSSQFQTEKACPAVTANSELAQAFSKIRRRMSEIGPSSESAECGDNCQNLADEVVKDDESLAQCSTESNANGATTDCLTNQEMSAPKDDVPQSTSVVKDDVNMLTNVASSLRRPATCNTKRNSVVKVNSRGENKLVATSDEGTDSNTLPKGDLQDVGLTSTGAFKSRRVSASVGYADDTLHSAEGAHTDTSKKCVKSKSTGISVSMAELPPPSTLRKPKSRKVKFVSNECGITSSVQTVNSKPEVSDLTKRVVVAKAVSPASVNNPSEMHGSSPSTQVTQSNSTLNVSGKHGLHATVSNTDASPVSSVPQPVVIFKQKSFPTAAVELTEELPNTAMNMSMPSLKSSDSGQKANVIRIQKSNSISLKPAPPSSSTAIGSSQSQPDSAAKKQMPKNIKSSAVCTDALNQKNDLGSQNGSWKKKVSKCSKLEQVGADDSTAVVGGAVVKDPLMVEDFESLRSEPSWFALAKQKTQKWMEGQVS